MGVRSESESGRVHRWRIHRDANGLDGAESVSQASRFAGNHDSNTKIKSHISGCRSICTYIHVIYNLCQLHVRVVFADN